MNIKIPAKIKTNFRPKKVPIKPPTNGPIVEPICWAANIKPKIRPRCSAGLFLTKIELIDGYTPA